MAPGDTFARPAFAKLVLSLALGIGMGAAFVLPVVREDLAPIASGDSGAVGGVILVGILFIMIVTTGLFGLYRISR